MKRFGPHLLFSLLVLAAAITLACGSSPHLLQSISVSPSTADAQSYPNGLVPFTATGVFNSNPNMVTPLHATWGACVKTANSEQPTNAVTVSSTGVAQCVAGNNGTYTVWASGSNPGTATCMAISPCGDICSGITGYAQITCP